MLIAALLAGCGSGGSTTEAETDAQASKLYPWLKGPTREFLVPNGDNVVQLYGREASPAERKEASKTIEAWMRARAAGEWSKECRYMHESIIRASIPQAEGILGRKVKSCAQALAAFATREKPGHRSNTMTGPIDSLRIQEGQGYAQYHGRADPDLPPVLDGRDWVVTVLREGGEWKVADTEPRDRMK